MIEEAERGEAPLGDEQRATVDRRLKVGVALTVASVAALFLGTSIALWDGLGLGLYYVLLPSLAVAQLPLLRTAHIDRIPVYLGSAMTIGAIAVIAIGLSLRSTDLSGFGLLWLPTAEMAGWVVGTTLAGLGIIQAFHPSGRAASAGGFDFVMQLIPRTRRERRVFAGLSLVAGLGEEAAYRGYALSAIQLIVPGPWTAAVLSSIAFGALHAYQGHVGILRTGLIGFVLAVPVLVTGSLVPSMIAHASIDLVAGLVIGPRMVTSAETGP